jgi:hypothetical protein
MDGNPLNHEGRTTNDDRRTEATPFYCRPESKVQQPIMRSRRAKGLTTD